MGSDADAENVREERVVAGNVCRGLGISPQAGALVINYRCAYVRCLVPCYRRVCKRPCEKIFRTVSYPEFRRSSNRRCSRGSSCIN